MCKQRMTVTRIPQDVKQAALPDTSTAGSTCMSTELARYASFKDFPVDSPAMPSRLAQAGFFYSGQHDETVCFRCGLTYQNWPPRLSALELHLRLSPNCEFLKGVANSLVGPASSSGPLRRETRQPLLNRLEAGNVAPPRHPQYADRQARRLSFSGWTSELQAPEELAEAGFFFAGFGDCVKCFQCGGGLRNWKADDSAREVHETCFPRCSFLKANRRREEGVAAIQQTNKDVTATTGVSSQHQFRSDQSTSGHPTSQCHVKGTCNLLAQQQGMCDLVAQQQGTCDLVAQQQGMCDLVLKQQGAFDTMTTDEQSRQLQNGQKLQKSKGDDAVAHETAGQVLKTGFSEGIAAEAARKSRKEKEVKGESSRARAESIPKPGNEECLPVRQVNARLKEENRRLRELFVCKVCMDKDSAIVFLPCGHVVTCPDCAPCLKACVMCRRKINGTVRAYLL